MIKTFLKIILSAALLHSNRFASECQIARGTFIPTQQSDSCEDTASPTLADDGFCSYACPSDLAPPFVSQQTDNGGVFNIGCARQGDGRYALTSPALCVPVCVVKTINDPTVLLRADGACYASVLASGAHCDAVCTSNGAGTTLTCAENSRALSLSPVCATRCAFSELGLFGAAPQSEGGGASVGEIAAYECRANRFVRDAGTKRLSSVVQAECLRNGTFSAALKCVEGCAELNASRILSCDGYERLVVGEECRPVCRGPLSTRNGAKLRCAANQSGDAVLNADEVCGVCDLSAEAQILSVRVGGIVFADKVVARGTSFSVACAEPERRKAYFGRYACDEGLDVAAICVRNCTEKAFSLEITPVSVRPTADGYELRYGCGAGHISSDGFHANRLETAGLSTCARLTWDMAPACFGYCGLAQLSLAHGRVGVPVLPETKALPYSCDEGFSAANRTKVVCGRLSAAGFSLSAPPVCLADACAAAEIGDVATRVVCDVEQDATRCRYECRDGFISASSRAQPAARPGEFARGEYVCSDGAFAPKPACERCFIGGRITFEDCVVPPLARMGASAESPRAEKALAFEGEAVVFKCGGLEKQTRSRNLFGEKEYTAVCAKGAWEPEIVCAKNTGGVAFIVAFTLTAAFLGILVFLWWYIRRLRAKNIENMRRYQNYTRDLDLSKDDGDLEFIRL